MNFNKKRDKLEWLEEGIFLHFISSAIAGFLAVLGGSPADVVKSRCIDGLKIDGKIHYYNSIVECSKVLYKMEGWKGFYAGFNANVSRLVMWNIIMFITREQLKMRWWNFKQRK
jgi:hypothetical protein